MTVALFLMAPEFFQVLSFLDIHWDLSFPREAENVCRVTGLSPLKLQAIPQVSLWGLLFTNRNHQVYFWRVRNMPPLQDPHHRHHLFPEDAASLWVMRMKTGISNIKSPAVYFLMVYRRVLIYTFSGGSARKLRLLSGHWHRGLAEGLEVLKWKG